MQIIIISLDIIKRKTHILFVAFLLLGVLFLSFSSYAQINNYTDNEFVEIKANLPEIQTDVRYAGTNNFVGRPIPGYNAEMIILSKPAADSLTKVIKYLINKGYGLIIYDAYRPQKAVDYFRQWSRNLGDTISKADFYPFVAKNDLFRLGYIATKSGHSRGSTVDLSLTDLKTGKEVDMGGTYDYFDESSWSFTDKVSPEQQNNRSVLREAMLKYGFKPIHTEWWHFTLRNEPYPDTYFDFDVE